MNDELEKLLAAATPGPWTHASDKLAAGNIKAPDNAALICAAVNALPELLAMAEENARLREALRPLEWQPIETAPKDGTAILIYHQNAYAQAVAAPVIDGWFLPRGGPVKNPTHWQPLPTPPANQEAET